MTRKKLQIIIETVQLQHKKENEKNGGILTNMDMTYQRKKALIVAQAIGFVFGLIFGISEGYEGFWEIVGAVTVGPIAFAALLRFSVRAYQFGKVKLGIKVQGPDGGYAIIEKPGRGVFAAVVAFFLPVAVLSLFANAPQALMIAYLVVLIVVGALFCCLDIKYMVNYKHKKRE